MPEAPIGPTLVTPPPTLSLIHGEADPTPLQARLRAKLRVLPDHDHASKRTVPNGGGTHGRLHRDEIAVGKLLDPSSFDRPRTRGDCATGGSHENRPCPWVSCRHHLAIEVDPRGALTLNFPDTEVWEMPDTCSLDVADRGGVTLEEVGKILNRTRERIRQIETHGLERMAKQVKREGLEAPDDDDRLSPLASVICEG
jgi:hypothetical protein